MRPHPRRLLWLTALPVLLPCALGARAAFADASDIPFLTVLVANAGEQLTLITEELRTARLVYDKSRELAGYAADAQTAFQDFSHLNGQLFAEHLEQAVDAAFPDLVALRQMRSGTGEWAHGTGELQRMLALCLDDQLRGRSLRCARVQEALSLGQVRTALAATFGPVPPTAGAPEMLAVDEEAAKAIVASHDQTQRDAIERARADFLQAQCTDHLLGGGPQDAAEAARCQAAANAAVIASYSVLSRLTDQVSQTNRLAAVGLEQQNSRYKREYYDLADQHAWITSDVALLTAPPPRLLVPNAPQDANPPSPGSAP